MRLFDLYTSEVRGKLFKDLGHKSIMQTPRLEKIVISVCDGREAVKNAKVAGIIAGELTDITGQRAMIARSKKAVANFKLRKHLPMGAYVTLRREKMWAFLDRLVSIVLPRVRDFRGISPKGFDGRGNYNMGLKEQIVFPEINYDKADQIRGMNITICTTAKSDKEAHLLLQALGMPFRK